MLVPSLKNKATLKANPPVVLNSKITTEKQNRLAAQARLATKSSLQEKETRLTSKIDRSDQDVSQLKKKTASLPAIERAAKEQTTKLMKIGVDQEKTAKTANKALKKTQTQFVSSQRDKQQLDTRINYLNSIERGIKAVQSGKALFDPSLIAVDVSKALLDAGGHTEEFVIRTCYKQYDSAGAPYYNGLIKSLEFQPLFTLGGDVAPTYFAGVASPVSISSNPTWPGGTGDTATVTMSDTSQLAVGNAIWGDADQQKFEVISITEDTSVVVANPHGLTLPTGALASSVGVLPALMNGELTVTVQFPDGTYVLTETSTLKVQVVAGDTLLGWAMKPITVTYTVVA